MRFPCLPCPRRSIIGPRIVVGLTLLLCSLILPLSSIAAAEPEAYKSGSSVYGATEVITPWSSGNYTLSIDPCWESDYFSFYANEGDHIKVRAETPNYRPGVYIELYGPDSDYLALDEGDSGGWGFVLLDAYARDTGVHYVKVKLGVWGGLDPQPYGLVIDCPRRVPTTTTTRPPSTTTTTTSQHTRFWDVPAAHPYASAIEQLAARDVVDGQTDGSFGLYQMIFRQQFAKMLVNVLGFAPTEADVCHFPDVDKPSTSLYPDNYVAVAAKHGLVTGYADGRFGPYDSITRAQVLTMVVRAAPLAGLQLSEPDSAYYTSGVNRNFNDPTHGHNAQLAEFNGLCGGLMLDPDYRWNPWVVATRGEVAQVLWRLVYLSGR